MLLNVSDILVYNLNISLIYYVALESRNSDKFKLYLYQNIAHKVKVHTLLFIDLLSLPSFISVSVEIIVNR